MKVCNFTPMVFISQLPYPFFSNNRAPFCSHLLLLPLPLPIRSTLLVTASFFRRLSKGADPRLRRTTPSASRRRPSATAIRQRQRRRVFPSLPSFPRLLSSPPRPLLAYPFPRRRPLADRKGIRSSLFMTCHCVPRGRSTARARFSPSPPIQMRQRRRRSAPTRSGSLMDRDSLPVVIRAGKPTSLREKGTP